jgi:hypothetical protein
MFGANACRMPRVAARTGVALRPNVTFDTRSCDLADDPPAS